MSSEKCCGKLGRVPFSVIADRAARFVMDFKCPRAVTLDPDGHVWVESPAHVVDEDLVGTYDQRPGLLALWKQIDADLRHAVDLRQVVAGPAVPRGRIYRGRTKKEAA